MANPKKDTVKPEVQTPTPEELEAQRLAEVEAQKAAEAKTQQEGDEKAAQDAEAQRIAAEQKAREAAAEKARLKAEEKARKEAEAKAAEQTARLADPLLCEALALLKAHPDQEVVYMTTDRIGYFRELDAANHAAVLGDKIVKPVNRDGYVQE